MSCHGGLRRVAFEGVRCVVFDEVTVEFNDERRRVIDNSVKVPVISTGQCV